VRTLNSSRFLEKPLLGESGFFFRSRGEGFSFKPPLPERERAGVRGTKFPPATF